MGSPDHRLAQLPDVILEDRAGSVVVHVTKTFHLVPTHLPLKSSLTMASKPARQEFRGVFKKTILDVSATEGGNPKK
jgi:hypothetical protein